MKCADAEFWVYVLENASGQFYVGSTDDMLARLEQHNSPGNDGSAAGQGPWRLVWSEGHPTRSSAMQREREIKGMNSSQWIRENLLTS